ncbi:cysteine desulfurase-like protein [Tranquillimonas alkanivorans]|uniref:Cysteine desulfurase family protein, VC1184 subfamily n=1 Tax=Tranquillimonas alkanivorans TaxID=441119 RepID=A0A1I5UIG2_9RHOB|nr:cysteine desulfurase-like protein [Tranquillimonas alkanivorans]SFP95064.1 cysteine desulfurase family protein, VC1184 subfamily [Tranquillimonas alkanivorans]
MTDITTPLDMEFVHSQFPGLRDDWVFFDNAGGSQTVKGAVDRITEFLFERNVQIGGSYAISQAAAEALMKGREAGRTLVNAERPEEIVFGPSTTVLLQTLAAAMRSQFHPGDEIIVTMADHESNIGPWDRLREFGVVVKFWPLDRESYRLRLSDLEPLMTERTKLVCVTHASNILGKVNPVAQIAEFVHARGAKICVDAVAYAPHRLIDVRAWDVDYYVFSLYKAYGPHAAMMYGKYELLRELDGLYHYFYGKDKVPGKLEPGNPSYELAYSTDGIVEYLAALGECQGVTGDRRAKVEAAYAAITRHEDRLTERLLSWLNARNDVRVIGETVNEDSTRVPTIAFKFDGVDSGAVARAMDAYGIAIRFGDFHSRRLVEDLGEDGDNGVLRVSMVHYNTVEQVDRLTAALSEIVSKVAA